MTKEAENYQRKQVQRSMFRTVAQNLIKQLQDDGCTREELIGFANEILQTILDQGFEPSTEAQQAAGLGGNGVVHRVEGLARLSAQASTSVAEGVSVRPVRQDDAPMLKQWLDDQAVSQSLAEYTLAEIIDAASCGQSPADQAVFVMRRDADDKPIGLVGLIHIDREAAQGELVKMIGAPQERGKGLAKRATQMLVDFGFEQLKLNRIYLRTLGGNMKNIRLNESLGFQFEGLLRQAASLAGKLNDVIIMGMVAEDRPAQLTGSQS